MGEFRQALGVRTIGGLLLKCLLLDLANCDTVCAADAVAVLMLLMLMLLLLLMLLMLMLILMLLFPILIT